jgi:hypothetical protein
MGAENAELQAIRRDALARASAERGQQAASAANEELAASYRAMADAYRSREMIFTATAEDRREWEATTGQPRRLAIAADNELRRRHPEQHLQPLRSAEPEPVSEAEQAELVLAPDKEIAGMSAWITELAAQRQAFADKLAERRNLMIPAEDPDYEDLGQAFPALGAAGKDAILQPPKPMIKPSAGDRARPEIDPPRGWLDGGRRHAGARGGHHVPPMPAKLPLVVTKAAMWWSSSCPWTWQNRPFRAGSTGMAVGAHRTRPDPDHAHGLSNGPPSARTSRGRSNARRMARAGPMG